MPTWIRFDAIDDPVPGKVVSLADALASRRSALAAQTGPTGGLQKLDLVAALAPIVRSSSLTTGEHRTFGGGEIDLTSMVDRVAVSMQTGRARTNNGGLLSVLAAAAIPDVDWLVILAPERYKGTLTARPVEKELRLLAVTAGVRLSLKGVSVIQY